MDVARRLLLHLLAALSPSGKMVVGIDDTIERRWGGKIKTRGIYRDAARSSHGRFIKTSGLHWLSLAVMPWALAFLTVLPPSVRWSAAVWIGERGIEFGPAFAIQCRPSHFGLSGVSVPARTNWRRDATW
jgi:hypothetical protein